jgi:hypothetical protein
MAPLVRSLTEVNCHSPTSNYFCHNETTTLQILPVGMTRAFCRCRRKPSFVLTLDVRPCSSRAVCRWLRFVIAGRFVEICDWSVPTTEHSVMGNPSLLRKAILINTDPLGISARAGGCWYQRWEIQTDPLLWWPDIAFTMPNFRVWTTELHTVPL